MEEHISHKGHMKQIECDPSCGFTVKSHDEDEVVKMAMEHIRNKHPDMELSEEDAKGMVKTV